MLRHHQISPTKPARVIILGSCGFVARHLVRHLAAEKIDHRAIGSSEIDLMLPKSVGQLEAELRQDDAVVVTSGLTPDKGKDVQTLMKNLSMGQHLAAAFENTACSQVIYISSDAVYDWRDNLIRETSARQASDLYSLMHIAREQILSFALAKAKVPLCLFCPCAIHGAGDTHNSYGPNRFLRDAIKDRKITLFGNGEEIRDHVYIEDISRLITLCLLRRSDGVINAVSGNAVTFHDVAVEVQKLCGPDVTIECLPRGGPIMHRHFDVTERVRAFTEFTPSSLATGLAESYRQLTGAQED
ncbi:MAG TPA: NAD(P)-dependent oxidoreductase [Chthoniobacterales bacterium]|nr:NAD(P)-dependent oxidoreductase [Chthoniobacterales bacterium]